MQEAMRERRVLDVDRVQFLQRDLAVERRLAGEVTEAIPPRPRGRRIS
jgi:hypothetical protein